MINARGWFVHRGRGTRGGVALSAPPIAWARLPPLLRARAGLRVSLQIPSALNRLVSGVPSERAEHAECETRSPSQARPAAGKGDSSSLGAYASVPVPELGGRLGGRGHVLNSFGALSGGAAAACGDCERDRDDML